MSAFGAPGRVARAASISSWMRFLSGQAGVVNTTRIATVCGLTRVTSWIIFSSTIPRWSSGSFTVLSAASTISSVRWVTAIKSILPRRTDVTHDDVIDQAFHRRQVIGEDDPVRMRLPEVAAGQGIADDGLQLGIRLCLRTGTEQFQRGGRVGGEYHAVVEAPGSVDDKRLRKDRGQGAGKGVDQPVIGLRAAHVHGQDPVRGKVFAGVLEKFFRRQVEGDVRLTVGG